MVIVLIKIIHFRLNKNSRMFLSGVGYASVIVDWLIALYYNVVVAQCLFYFFASMTSELPWASCNNTWNTENCAWNSEYSIII